MACSQRDERPIPPGPDDPKSNLTQLDRFADRVQLEALSTSWEIATDASATPNQKPFGIKPLLLLTDEEMQTLRSKLQNSKDQDCLDAIHATAIRMQSDSNMESKFLLEKIASIRGRIPEFGQTLIDESDASVRKESWYAQKDIAEELDPLLRRIADLRNRWASRRSDKDFLNLMEYYRGYDVATKDRLEMQVRKHLSSPPAMRFPWSVESENPELVLRLAKRFDAPGCLGRASFIFKLLDLPVVSTNLQIKQPSRIGFSTFSFYPVNPPKDVRITVRPGAGIGPHWAAFHEYGHAAMSLLTEESSCLTHRRPFCLAVSEGCAKVSERIFYSEEWLRQQNVHEVEILELQEWERESELARMRSILADLEFEEVFYSNSEEDLTLQYRAIQKKTAGIDVPPDFPAWALKRDLAYEPLARSDYLLARCAQAAIYRRLRGLPGGIFGNEARAILKKDVFSSTSLRFEDWFRKAAKMEPDCTPWLEDVAKINVK